MLRLDSFLLDYIFQPLQNWFQKSFGINCFLIAKAECIVASTTYLIGFKLYYDYAFLFLGFSWAIGIFIADFHEKQTMDNFSNQARLEYIVIRIFLFLTFFLAMIVTSLHIMTMPSRAGINCMNFVGIFNGLCGIYFMSCTPLPPCKSKVKAWIEKIKKAITSKPLQPIPLVVDE